MPKARWIALLAASLLAAACSRQGASDEGPPPTAQQTPPAENAADASPAEEPRVPPELLTDDPANMNRSIQKGMLYPEARALLIQQGFKPVSVPAGYGQRAFFCGDGEDEQCKAYPEWFDMSSGLAFSSFLFRRPDGREMVVTTQGELLDRAVVTGWTTD